MSDKSKAVAVIVNGVPRSGKTTLAGKIMAAGAGRWVNLGVDSTMALTRRDLWPAIGLRPGSERPDLEPLVLASYEQLFNDIADHLRAGVNVVADVGIHDDYTQPLDILGEMNRRLAGLDVVVVGLHCSLEVLRERREQSGYLSWQPGEQVPEAVLRWQNAVHRGKQYDLEVDTTSASASDCAAVVLDYLRANDDPIT